MSETEASAPEAAASLHITAEGGRCRIEGARRFFSGYRVEGSPDGGIFAEWEWDGTALHLRTCRYGLVPVYVWANAREICVSTSLLVVLGRSGASDFDHDALAVFLRLGFFLGEDTPFRHIKVLPPGARGEWRPGSFALQGRRPETRPHNWSRNQTMEAYADLFEAAVARCRPEGAFAVPLSGGRDSRHILFALLRQNMRPDFCVTTEHFPPKSNEDVVVAGEVARALGIPHRILHRPRSRLRSEWRKNRMTDFCTDEHGWALPLVDALAGSVTAIHDGIAGDVLSAGLFLDRDKLDAFAQGELRPLAHRLLDAEREPIWREVLAPGFFHEVGIERAVARLLREFAQHEAAANPVTSFYFWNRTRREIGLFGRMFPSSVTVFCPYLDPAVFDLLTGSPPSFFLDHSFHTETIARAYPDFARLRYEDKSVPARPEPAYWRRFAIETATCLARHGGDVINRRHVLPRLAKVAAEGGPQGLWFLPSRVDPVMPIYLAQLAHVAQRASKRLPL